MIRKESLIDARDAHRQFVYDLIKRKTIKLRYCPSNEEKTNILTKVLNRVKFLN